MLHKIVSTLAYGPNFHSQRFRFDTKPSEIWFLIDFPSFIFQKFTMLLAKQTCKLARPSAVLFFLAPQGFTISAATLIAAAVFRTHSSAKVTLRASTSASVMPGNVVDPYPDSMPGAKTTCL